MHFGGKEEIVAQLKGTKLFVVQQLIRTDFVFEFEILVRSILFRRWFFFLTTLDRISHPPPPENGNVELINRMLVMIVVVVV